ncbi:hypothetical protein ENUP19_0146G0070 [Entamoeba nuttalli]|uniref:Protein kinase, putative n=2 Tax=Entamoeba nuttalli TaxID=412467 RepID=K2HTP7_ENTNP|nr:protein kinase, putative [Entamoeba nuttalli P19]EKE39510.1 protein kinase, putative [Entamoeba nuttalli P19]|eukprot:XP_008858157.1 protein kinase, putative [Entamoeba nuttalli P19]
MNSQDFDFNEFEEDSVEEKNDDYIIIDGKELNNNEKTVVIKNEKQLIVMKETIIVSKYINKTQSSQVITVNDIQNEMYSIEFHPRKLLLQPNEIKELTICVKPFCSCYIDCSVFIFLNLTQWKSYDFKFTSEPSLWINPQFIQGLDAKKELGRGSFGIVFEGVYNSMKCAIKRINGSLDLIEKELQIITSLRNPFLIQCYGMVYYSSTIHIIMELAPCGSFDKCLKEMNYEIKMKVLIDVLKGIQFLHRNNIIHRDIKPANVVLFNTKKVVDINAKLTDFGSSTLKDESHMTGGVGTISYMAPEVMKMEMYGFECDIYSFGMMLYEVISQRELFSGMKSYEIKQFILEGKRPKQTTVISSRIYSIIEGCWSQDPKNRWGCEELIEKIQKIRSGTNEMMVSPIPKIEKHGYILEGTQYIQLNQSTLSFTVRNTYYNGNDGKSWYFKGKEMKKTGRRKEALEAFKKGGKNLLCKKELSKIYIEENMYKEAIDLLIECLYENDYESEELLLDLMDNSIRLNDEQINKYLEYLTLNGNKDAMFELAKRSIYLQPTNLLKSERLLRQLVNEQYPGSEVQLGLLLFMIQEDSESNKMALELFNKASICGDVYGINNSGVFYSLGYGTSKQINKALHLFDIASSHGSGIAENNKGVILFSGNEHENEIRDCVEALQCFIRSSEKGCKEGMFNASVCYFNGDGVEKDDYKAIEYLKKSAELGYAEAECLLASCYKYGTGVKMSNELYVQWTLQAANNGSSIAMFNVGCWYYLGENFKVNKKEAVKWYYKSAKEGYGKAMCNLGRCYFDGEGVECNKKKAFKWFKRSAKKGIVSGQFNCSNCYYYGDGTQRNIDKAMYWSKLASINGHARAFIIYGKCLLYYYQFEEARSVFEEALSLNIKEPYWYLGLLYEYGAGGIQNPKLALKYYQNGASELNCCKEKIALTLFHKEKKLHYLKDIKKRSSLVDQIIGKELIDGPIDFCPSEGTFLLFQAAKCGNENAFNYLLQTTEMKDDKVIEILNELYYNCLNKEQPSQYVLEDVNYNELL